MTDKEFVEKLIASYRQLPDSLPIKEGSGDLVRSIMDFMVKTTRVQPPLPENVDITKDSFTTFNFLIKHEEDGRVTVNATSMLSRGRKQPDLELDIGILREYLDTVIETTKESPTSVN
jgi:hypothetical protein